MYLKICGSVLLSAFIIGPTNHTIGQNRPTRLQQKVNVDSIAQVEGSEFISNPKHVGLSIGVFDNGKKYTYNFGSTKKGKSLLPTANSIYEMGSVTKSFMGLLLGRAVIDKRVDLNDDLTKYLGAAYSNLSVNGRSVKIKDLATHTAGFGKNIPDLSKLTPLQINDLFKTYTKDDFLADLRKVKLNAVPGTMFRYSNAGTQLTEIIVEKVYHKSFADLVKEKITDPNGMNHTGTDVAARDEDLYVEGYDGNGVQMPRPDLWKRLPAAGYLKSSVNDMLKYISLNINENIHPEVKLAHTSIFKHTDEDDADIGLFWFVKTNAQGQREVMHAGGSFGTTSFLLISPGQRKGIICFANDASGSTEHELRVLAEKILTGI